VGAGQHLVLRRPVLPRRRSRRGGVGPRRAPGLRAGLGVPRLHLGPLRLLLLAGRRRRGQRSEAPLPTPTCSTG
jgi:hypothetical protein